jgi:MYXO-CTERM domain-containing protein
MESTHTCTGTIANGIALPTDGPHATPTLDGTCAQSGAADLVCTSHVCDTDNKCGYLDGSGSCDQANAATVCRSGACGGDGKCKAADGCNVDSDCTSDKWCNESSHACTPKLTNGTAMPSDAAHGSPTLDGKCTSAAAALVCASGVCDADNKCGLVDGNGPCTGNASVCRSGSCNAARNKCGPAGSCDVDSDCTDGKWCNESAHACTAKLANGAALPTDAPHSNPTLDGTCTAGAGALVCASGVCDHDNACGLADGDGPCTKANAGTVCRSGACSVNGTCEPANGCQVDADCTGGNWCDVSTHACTPQFPNGATMPKDPNHVNLVVDGTCNPAAGTLVCASGVCDHDNQCGFGDGSGPCTTANAEVVCRSHVCVDGTCGASAPAATPNDSGYLEGGGIGCSATGASSATGSMGMLGALSVLGALSRRRRARDAR